jgi:tight adherence protein B
MSVCIFLVFSEIFYILKNKKKDLLNSQLAEFLSSAIVMLRAGRSIRSIIREYCAWAKEPLKLYLKTLSDELEMNVSFDEAVDNFAAKCSNKESLIFSTALKLNNKIGGDLIFIIEKIIETLNENRKLVSNVKILTLQSRYSGNIISFLPVAALIAMFIFMNSSITRFFAGGPGSACLIVGSLLEITGIVIIRKVLGLSDRFAEKTGAALKIFLNGRILKKYQSIADRAFLTDSSREWIGDNCSDGLARSLNILIGYKFLAAFLAAFFSLFFLQNIMFMVLVGAVSAAAGFFVPDFILNYISRRRIKEFNKDLPYIIDLLQIATLAGQNIYNSIKIVSEKYDGNICAALKKFLNRFWNRQDRCF